MSHQNTSEQLNSLKEFEYEKTSVLAGIPRMVEMIALKPVCENLQISWSWQFEQLKNDERFNQLFGKEKVLSKDGKSYQMICLPPTAFQNWLWTINPTENMNIELWETYKKGLVVYLMEMLKISLDEIRRLRSIANAYDELVEDTKSYFDATDESLELRKQAKEISNRQKEIRKRILAKVNIDPNQLGIEFY